MIPVVKWARKGFASELPILPQDIAENKSVMVEREQNDEFNFAQYDNEDSMPNQRSSKVCF